MIYLGVTSCLKNVQRDKGKIEWSFVEQQRISQFSDLCRIEDRLRVQKFKLTKTKINTRYFRSWPFVEFMNVLSEMFGTAVWVTNCSYTKWNLQLSSFDSKIQNFTFFLQYEPNNVTLTNELSTAPTLFPKKKKLVQWNIVRRS